MIIVQRSTAFDIYSAWLLHSTDTAPVSKNLTLTFTAYGMILHPGTVWTMNSHSWTECDD